MKRILAIIVCKTNNLFYEKEYYKTLQKIGKEKNIEVFVCYPDQINFSKNIVNGFQYNFNLNKWQAKEFPIPNIIYDRCFYVTSNIYKFYKPYINLIKQNANIRFLGIGLKGKMEVYNILSENKFIAKYLPKTEKFQNLIQLNNWLEKYPIILKPTGGSHGRGIIKITKVNKSYKIIGRNPKNEIISYSFSDIKPFKNWLIGFIKNKNYLIQQYLNLTTSDNRPYDIRVLIQKNHMGLWEITGMAARFGKIESLTSNLHGGGTVENVKIPLAKEYGEEKAAHLINEISNLSIIVPKYIEKKHGNLVEIGLDFGIDNKGTIWLLEANSKPGRKVFSLLNDNDRLFKAISQPINYSEFLLRKNIKI